MISVSTPPFLLEILDNVFSSTPKHDLVATARTCHRWSDVALNSIWRDLQNLIPLLKTYAPLVQEPDSDCWV